MSPESVTNYCPYCHRAMQVSRMSCPSCAISVDADFPAPRLAQLPVEHQRFIEMFYPTVRSRLYRIIETLQRVVAENSDGSEESFSDKERTEAVARLIKAI